MTTAAIPMSACSFEESRWFAAYTSPRHEKHVSQQMERRGIQNFLPLYTSIRRWKDRRKELELPIFPGYLFVRMALRETSARARGTRERQPQRAREKGGQQDLRLAQPCHCQPEQRMDLVASRHAPLSCRTVEKTAILAAAREACVSWG